MMQEQLVLQRINLKLSKAMTIHYPIETSRLQLTPFTLVDGDALYRLESDPVVKRFIGGTLLRVQTEQLLRSFIAWQVAHKETLVLIFILLGY